MEGTKDAGEGEGSASSVQRPVSSVASGGKSVVEGMVEGAKDAGEGKGEPDLNTTAADREQVEDTGPEAVNWSCDWGALSEASWRPPNPGGRPGQWYRRTAYQDSSGDDCSGRSVWSWESDEDAKAAELDEMINDGIDIDRDHADLCEAAEEQA